MQRIRADFGLVSPYLLKTLLGIASFVGITVGAAIWSRRGRRVLRDHGGGSITHHRKSRFLESVFLLVPCLVITALLVTLGENWGEPALAVVGLAATALVIWRMFVVSVTVDDDEIRIRNFLRNYCIRWQDVASIGRRNSRTWSFVSWFGSDDGVPRTVCLELRNGTRRYVSATAALRASNFSDPDVRILRAFEDQAEAHGVQCAELDSAALVEMGLS